MIKVDWVGFESRLDLGHKLGIEVEDTLGSWFMGSWEMWSASLSEYVILNSEGRHLTMAWLRVVLSMIFCTVEMLW